MWILFSNGAKVFVSFPGSVARAFGVGLQLAPPDLGYSQVIKNQMKAHVKPWKA